MPLKHQFRSIFNSKTYCLERQKSMIFMTLELFERLYLLQTLKTKFFDFI